MKLRDGRKVTGRDLQERRMQAVMLHKKGETQEEIGRLVAVHRVTVGGWIRKWKAEGAGSLKPKRRGVKRGAARTLTPEQEKREKG
jgi:transposase